MTRVRNLWEELVDRRLWPVAALLVLALIAVPLLLAKPAPQEEVAQTAPGVRPTPAPLPGGAPVSDVTGTAYVGPVRGLAKDPFRPRGGVFGGSPAGSVASALASASASAVAASAPSGGGSSSSGASGSSGSGSSGASGSAGPGSGPGSGSGTAPSGRPVPGVRPAAVAALEFGLLGGEARARRVAELTPLPSPVSPAVVYLGQTRSGESAFLVSSDARATGQGRCTPNRRTCSTLYLRQGQVAYLTVDTTAGRAIRYRLKFVGRLPS